MRYLTLAAHYTASSIQETDGDLLRPEDLGLSDEICQALREWNDEYREILSLDSAGRRAQREEIAFLDERGLQLAGIIEQNVPGGAKVSYYSEGEMKHLKLG